MTAVWIGLASAFLFLVLLVFLPCPACEARRARIVQAVAKFQERRN